MERSGIPKENVEMRSPRSGASTDFMENIIAARFRIPATAAIVETYRYFAATILTREVATVISVSQVDFSRSPAVQSIAGCMLPTATMMIRKMGIMRPRMNCPICLSVAILFVSTQNC